MIFEDNIKKGTLVFFIKEDEIKEKIEYFKQKFKNKIIYSRECDKYYILIIAEEKYCLENRLENIIDLKNKIDTVIGGYYIKIRKKRHFLKILKKFLLLSCYNTLNIRVDNELIEKCGLICFLMKECRNLIIDFSKLFLFVGEQLMNEICKVERQHSIDILFSLKHLYKGYIPLEKGRILCNITYDYIKLSKRIQVIESTIRRRRGKLICLIMPEEESEFEEMIKIQLTELLNDFKPKILPILTLGILFYPRKTEYDFHIYFSKESDNICLKILEERLRRKIREKYVSLMDILSIIKVNLDINIKIFQISNQNQQLTNSPTYIISNQIIP